MTPTNELRFVRRMEKGNESTYERTILQQKWVQELWGRTKEEWRDVPLEVENDG